MKPKRANFEGEKEYHKALADWYDQKAAEYLIKANELREKYGV